MVHSTPSTYNENKAANLEIVIQEFYSILLEKASSRPSLEKASSSEVSPSLENASSSKDSKEKKSSKVSPSNVVHYQNAVFDLLYFHKSRVLSESDLEELQCKIESMTCGYEAAANIYQQSPNLLKKLISMDATTVKESLKSWHSPDNVTILENFAEYTLEGIMIHVLGMVFNCVDTNSAVRASTLIDQLDSTVKLHAKILHKIKTRCSLDNSVFSGTLKLENRVLKMEEYAYGILLLEHLEKRGLIELTIGLNTGAAPPAIRNSNKKWYSQKHIYVVCNLNMSLLPITLNLPMVCPPLPWKPVVTNPISIADIKGGYLTSYPGEIYNPSYGLLTSPDFYHLYISLLGHDSKELCDVMNVLQLQAFEVNTAVLSFLEKNHDLLVQIGLLMPRFLASLNLKESLDLLRLTYTKKKEKENKIWMIFKIDELIYEFMTRVQRSRYETYIMSLASAYAGYRFYLPAFLDFRGRIYRSGSLHFHERDLARSLILFSNVKKKSSLTENQQNEVYRILKMAAAFHYDKFSSNDEAYARYENMVQDITRAHTKNDTMVSKEIRLIKLAVNAKNPFQFMSTVLCIEFDRINPMALPITQDASASAYQLISYYLLDIDLSQKTNLIPTGDGKMIQDVYTYFIEDLMNYIIDISIKNEKIISSNMLEIIQSKISRKLIKTIFMPMVYGKSLYRMAADIYEHYDKVLKRNDSRVLAFVCSEFMKDRYPGIQNLICIVKTVAWFASAMGHAVYYRVPLFTTVQDYLKSKPINIWVYDRSKKKRRKVTLRVSTEDHDRRKTVVSTFANFIHQKDASVAMHTVMEMHKGEILPVYTVHDNFITTANNVKIVSQIYSRVLTQEHPMVTINWFINKNIIYKGSRAKTSFYYKQEPIPKGWIREQLEAEMPKDNKQKTIWEEKIALLEKSYEEYVNLILYRPYSKDDSDHELYWKRYKEGVKRWSYLEFNHSLHF
jgi:hypothetical protein